MKGMRLLAHTISVLLHPILIPVLTVFLLARIDPLYTKLIPPEMLWRLLLAIGITTGVLPALSVLILSRSDLVQSIELKRRKERILPFIMTLFYLIATYIILLDVRLPTLLYAAILGGIVGFIGLILLTLRWRVSVHLCGYASLIGALCGLFVHSPFPLFHDLLVFMILIGGLLASARIYLGAHSLTELAVGTGWGFLCSFLFVSQSLFIGPSVVGWMG